MYCYGLYFVLDFVFLFFLFKKYTSWNISDFQFSSIIFSYPFDLVALALSSFFVNSTCLNSFWISRCLSIICLTASSSYRDSVVMLPFDNPGNTIFLPVTNCSGENPWIFKFVLCVQDAMDTASWSVTFLFSCWISEINIHKDRQVYFSLFCNYTVLTKLSNNLLKTKVNDFEV